jgi:hypothetical protein
VRQLASPVTKHIRLFTLPVISAKIPPLQSFVKLYQSTEVFFAVLDFPAGAAALP